MNSQRDLPSFSQFLLQVSLEHSNTDLQLGRLEEPHSSSSSKHVNCVEHASNIYRIIYDLERKTFQQELVISKLMKENQYLKAQIIERKIAKTEKIEKPVVCIKKELQVINQRKPLTLVQETSFSESFSQGEKDLSQYLVNWKGNQYVIINIFKNRDEVLSYYCPLYQTKFPNKEFKLVLQ